MSPRHVLLHENSKVTLPSSTDSTVVDNNNTCNYRQLPFDKASEVQLQELKDCILTYFVHSGKKCTMCYVQNVHNPDVPTVCVKFASTMHCKRQSGGREEGELRWAELHRRLSVSNVLSPAMNNERVFPIVE